MTTIRLPADGSAATVDDLPTSGDCAPSSDGHWRDVRVWTLHSAGRVTICTAFERATAEGYRYTVATPHGVKIMSQHAFRTLITARRQQKLDISEETKRRLWNAYQDGMATLMQALSDLHDSEAKEVVAS